jgi:NAD+ synthase
LHRRGAVVGISGGVDSSVVLALCTMAFGPKNVLGVILPERESNPESLSLAKLLAEQYQVSAIVEDITSALRALGCYRRRDKAIRRVFPEYTPTWKSKITLPGSLLEDSSLNFFSLTVIPPENYLASTSGKAPLKFTKRLPLREYFQIVAASNLKQRTRMAQLYYHAERHNYAVIGTGNKNEYDLGFFVKQGDGGADVAPIAHLFKTQVYQLARYLGVPGEILQRVPTTDTYNAGSTQEEFFFRLPFEILDRIWLGFEQGESNESIADALGLTEEQVSRVISDIQRKKSTTAYLRMPLLKFDW